MLIPEDDELILTDQDRTPNLQESINHEDSCHPHLAFGKRVSCYCQQAVELLSPFHAYYGMLLMP